MYDTRLCLAYMPVHMRVEVRGELQVLFLWTHSSRF